MTVKTIDARPRGPNQPMNASVGGLAFVPANASATGTHAHDREAEHAVERGLPRQVGEHRPDDRRAEDDERPGVRELAQLLERAGRRSGAAPECAEREPADERRDEAAAAERRAKPYAAAAVADRHDLEPGASRQACARATRKSAAPAPPQTTPKSTP